jgi:hypothetical protein
MLALTWHQSHQILAYHILRFNPNAILAIHPMDDTSVWLEKLHHTERTRLPSIRPLGLGFWIITLPKQATVFRPNQKQQAQCHQWCRFTQTLQG